MKTTGWMREREERERERGGERRGRAFRFHFTLARVLTIIFVGENLPLVIQVSFHKTSSPMGRGVCKVVRLSFTQEIEALNMVFDR